MGTWWNHYNPTDGWVIPRYGDREEVCSFWLLLTAADSIYNLCRTLIMKSALVYRRFMLRKAGLRMIFIRKLAPGHSIMRVCYSIIWYSSPLLILHLGSDDDHAVSILAGLLNKSSDAAFFHNRAVTNPFTLYNHDTGFMEARNANGSWAGPDSGWTEGDKWAYSFDVVQDIDGLIKARGGQTQFVKSLDEHFDGGGFLHIWWLA